MIQRVGRKVTKIDPSIFNGIKYGNRKLKQESENKDSKETEDTFGPIFHEELDKLNHKSKK